VVNDRWHQMKINELITSFEVWTTNEERKLLKKLDKPVKLRSLSEEDQFKIASMIRKSLVTKVGFDDPSVVKNEKI
jgi:hypothetical protein